MRARGKEGGRLWMDGWVGIGRKEEKSRVGGEEEMCVGVGVGVGVGGGIRTREEKGNGGLLTYLPRVQNTKLFFEN